LYSLAGAAEDMLFSGRESALILYRMARCHHMCISVTVIEATAMKIPPSGHGVFISTTTPDV
jgi:hypothetical protein